MSEDQFQRRSESLTTHDSRLTTHVVLILGGARSGKSSFAERKARELGEPVVFVATAAALDAEMAARIAAHRAVRPASWFTLEATTNIGNAIRERAASGFRTVLVDCLTLLVANHLGELSEDSFDEPGRVAPVQFRVHDEMCGLLEAVRAADANLVVVSNEVGMGIVPPFPLGRTYRDLLGRANQELAAAADAVYLMVAGIPLAIKS